MFGLRLGAMGRVGAGLTLTQQAINVLRKYGTDAHIYLPGIGVVNGLQAGNFSDTGGVTAAIVDSTAGVGRVNDGVGTINAIQGTTANKPVLRRGAVNRLLQTGFTGGTAGTVGSGAVAPTGWTFGFSGGTVAYVPAASGQGNAIRFVATAGRPMIQQNYSALAGMTYLLHMRVDAVVGSVRADIAAGFGGLPAGATQTWRVNGVVGGATLLQAGDRLEVLLVIGATAGTVQPRIGLGAVGSATGDITLANPQLETGSTANTYVPTTTAAASASTGPYWWEFDGTDFLSLANVPFGLNDDFAVVAGTSNEQNATNNRLFAAVGTTAVLRINWDTATSKYTAVFTNDAGASVVPASPAPAIALGQVSVVALRQSGSAKVLRTNAAAGAVNNAAVGVGTLTGASIGSQGGAVIWRGGIYPVIVIKGTVTDADLAILERYVAQASGVTL